MIRILLLLNIVGLSVSLNISSTPHWWEALVWEDPAVKSGLGYARDCFTDQSHTSHPMTLPQSHKCDHSYAFETCQRIVHIVLSYSEDYQQPFLLHQYTWWYSLSESVLNELEGLGFFVMNSFDRLCDSLHPN